jgi:hypothetical protein
MGSSPSSERKINAQEAYVRRNFDNTKKYFSELKFAI